MSNRAPVTSDRATTVPLQSPGCAKRRRRVFQDALATRRHAERDRELGGDDQDRGRRHEAEQERLGEHVRDHTGPEQAHEHPNQADDEREAEPQGDVLGASHGGERREGTEREQSRYGCRARLQVRRRREGRGGKRRYRGRVQPTDGRHPCELGVRDALGDDDERNRDPCDQIAGPKPLPAACGRGRVLRARRSVTISVPGLGPRVAHDAAGGWAEGRR